MNAQNLFLAVILRSKAPKDLFFAMGSYAVRRKDETQKQQILKFFH